MKLEMEAKKVFELLIASSPLSIPVLSICISDESFYASEVSSGQVKDYRFWAVAVDNVHFHLLYIHTKAG